MEDGSNSKTYAPILEPDSAGENVFAEGKGDIKLSRLKKACFVNISLLTALLEQ